MMLSKETQMFLRQLRTKKYMKNDRTIFNNESSKTNIFYRIILILDLIAS